MIPFTNSLDGKSLVLLTWLVSELIFVGVFYRVWLPRFQKLRPPAGYRDYGKDRFKLFMRIKKRIKKECKADNKPFLPTFLSSIQHWFHISTPDFCPKKGDVDQLFAWAFFGKHLDELEPWMQQDMARMHEVFKSDCNYTFPEGFTPECKPMLLSLDPLTPEYRPLLIYMIFLVIKIIGGLLLRAAGFYRCRTIGGLQYFYRPPQKDSDHTNKLPLIFLHGIAPGGLTFYLPMLFHLGGDGRPLFFFENPDISFSIFGGNPLNEHDTVEAIWEAVDYHIGSVQDVSVVGHSFGSCPVTWLIHSNNRARVRQIVLVDPVSIGLSEPDVMYNFLYSNRSKMGFISSEIFTQHYLRRHFAWYNSELWLEDLPKQTKVLVCLSERDRIVPVKKVYPQILGKPGVEVLLWKKVGHAFCVTQPKLWQQMTKAMRLQEQQIYHS